MRPMVSFKSLTVYAAWRTFCRASCVSRRGFLYLVAIMDWFSRKVLASRLSNSMDTAPCVEALKEALAKHGTPEIFNTDSHISGTSGDWINELTAAKIKTGMDGNGRWIGHRMGPMPAKQNQ